jgi:glycyl-tRNA synthetase (class II)
MQLMCCFISFSLSVAQCVGHADRAAYDLDVHSKATGADLTAQEVYAQPKQVHVAKFDVKNAAIGKAFGKKSKELTEAIRALPLDKAVALEAALAKDGSVLEQQRQWRLPSFVHSSNCRLSLWYVLSVPLLSCSPLAKP